MSVLLIVMTGSSGVVVLPSANAERFADKDHISTTAGSLSQQDDAPQSDDAPQPDDAPQDAQLFGRQKRIREGTVIPPTVGRVINLGRRWAFIPLNEQVTNRRNLTRHPSQTVPPPAANLTRVFDDRAPGSVQHGAEIGWNTSPRGSESPAANFNTPRPAKDNPTGDSNPNGDNDMPHIILCENQMLQRIIEATRADSSDNRWEISGEILEFFDQNRLLIRTIQRAERN